MANYLDNAEIMVAAPEKNHFDLGCQHITTSDFMELDCAYVRELVPNETIDIKMETFARMNAMPVPGFGRCVIKKSKFFVPMRQVYASFNDFVSDSVHINADMNPEQNSIPSSVPTIKNSELVTLFTGDTTVSASTSAQSYTERAMCYAIAGNVDSYDIAVVTGFTGSVGQIAKYNLTDTGRQILKLLQSLGYEIVWTSVTGDTGFDKTYNLMPLLGLMKIYADWYWPTQYSNVSIYQNMLMWCKKDNGAPLSSVSMSTFREILKQISYVQYDANYYSACFDNPVNPAANNQSNYVFKDVTVTPSTGSTPLVSAVNNAAVAGSTNKYGVPVINGTSYNSGVVVPNYNNSTYAISDYMLKGLRALSAFLRRNQLVGSKAYDRLMARYGVATPSEKLNRSVFLGSETQAVQIGDVMSTSDTDGANLGSYAGKGMSYGTTHLQYDTDEFGYVYILTSIVPIAQTYQGVDPMVLRTDRTSFYIPEFDSLSVEAVPSLSVYTPQMFSAGYRGLDNQTFGFLPRYSAYKSSVKDKLSGNFRVNSLNGTNPFFPNTVNGASSWHLMREFDDTQFPAASGIVHSIGYMYGYTDNWQYKRIFYGGALTEGYINPDNFTIVHNFEVGAYAPMKKLYDVIDELKVDDEHTHKNLKMQVGGVKVN